ncbi:hypothetical protein GCM10010399_63840 [Dactylosporangium fulvum]|uniref:Uncharacterized protein n=1 Tax=Dactylosporangium fulvum TaxID=53359 RepID=A0ABY5W6U8_9ACTN|nr:hypothetical protein [Dactylosporangium fulvum]UWP85793.1 hypothetical protein Dfulv_16735 [Dactylosporangium fulvum]
MSNPTARAVRIDLDEDETPATLYLLLSRDVVERLNQEFDVHGTSVPGQLGMVAVTLPMGAAADVARHFGRQRGADEARTEFYYCVTNVANRFWESGISEAPTVGLRANETTA